MTEIKWPTVDEFAQHIRWLNGSNKMGAGVLAERLLEWLQIRALASPPVAAQEEGDALIEAVAKVIYAQWSMLQGYTAWVERGNSIRQERARDIARQTLDSVAAMKGDKP